MLRQMERNTVQVMVKRRKSQRQIASELERSRTTIARVLQEPVEQPPMKRRRQSKVESYRSQIEQGISDGLSNVVAVPAKDEGISIQESCDVVIDILLIVQKHGQKSIKPNSSFLQTYQALRRKSMAKTRCICSVLARLAVV